MELTDEGDELVGHVERNLSIASAERDGEDFDPWDVENGYGPGGIGRFCRKIRGFRETQGIEPTTNASKFQISEKRQEILDKLDKHQVIVLVGTTGSGKSTYVPWLLLTGG